MCVYICVIHINCAGTISHLFYSFCLWFQCLLVSHEMYHSYFLKQAMLYNITGKVEYNNLFIGGNLREEKDTQSPLA